MTCCDLWDNPSLVKLYNHKLETESVHRMEDFTTDIDNEVTQKKCLPPNQQTSPIYKSLISNNSNNINMYFGGIFSKQSKES